MSRSTRLYLLLGMTIVAAAFTVFDALNPLGLDHSTTTVVVGVDVLFTALALRNFIAAEREG